MYRIRSASIKIKLHAIGILFLSLLFSAPCYAKVYMYEDSSGGMHFTDSPPNQRFKLFLDSLDNPKSKINNAIRRLAKLNNITQSLVRAVIRVESDFKPKAISRAGAMGLMQLMPETAADLDVLNPLDIEENIRGGVEYLRKQLQRFKRKDLALAAYNAGPGNVVRYNGIPPFPETQNYIKKVLRWEKHYAKK